jgi:hypothetical protein
MQGYILLEPILKKLSTIASGATPIGSAGRAPDEVSVSRIIKKAKEDLFIAVTPIGREFILVKNWEPKEFRC